MNTYVFGSLAFDRIMSFPGRFSDHILADKIHILNVCFVGNGLTERFGGTAGNIAYTMALLGEKPVILSSAGKDFGIYAKRLEALDLSTEGIRVVDRDFTANCHITTDKADNQITCFNPCAMNHQCGWAFNGTDPADCMAIVAPGNLADMIALPKMLKDKGVPYIFDPGQNITALDPADMAECIDGAWALISNDYELEMITRATGLSLEQILDRAENVITTLGEDGVRIHEPGDVITEVPAAPVAKVADPTGAGDSFRSGLLKGLSMGRSLPEAAKVGVVSAAYSVECLGTQEHSFTEEEFWSHYEDVFGA